MNKWLLPIVFLVVGFVVGLAIGSTGILGQGTVVVGGPVSKPTIEVTLFVGDSTTLTASSSGQRNYVLQLVSVNESAGGTNFLATFNLYQIYPNSNLARFVGQQTVTTGAQLDSVFGIDFKENPVVIEIGKKVVNNEGYATLEMAPVLSPST